MDPKPVDAPRFLILSVERSRAARSCVWWRPHAKGYTTFLGEAGRYTAAEVKAHADPPYHVAIHVDTIEIPRSALPALLKQASKVSRFSVEPVPSHVRPQLAELRAARERGEATCDDCGLPISDPVHRGFGPCGIGAALRGAR